MTNREKIDWLAKGQLLSEEELAGLLRSKTEEDRLYAAGLARTLTDRYYGRKIYFRGLIEFTNYCKNNCYYCGIRMW